MSAAVCFDPLKTEAGYVVRIRPDWNGPEMCRTDPVESLRVAIDDAKAMLLVGERVEEILDVEGEEEVHLEELSGMLAVSQ